MANQPNAITPHSSPITYFPGCALKDQAKEYEKATLSALAKLGYAVRELPRWNCCGTVYSQTQDDLMRHVGPVRNFIRAQELGETRLLTLCAMCYNTLSRSALFVQNPENLRRINAFMDDEEDYRGGVRVVHLAQFLLEEIGEEKLSQAVVKPLSGLRLGAYYGCTLLRPKEVAVDHPDRPEVLERIIASLGAEPIIFPERTECCGAYLAVTRPDRKKESGWAQSSFPRAAPEPRPSSPLAPFANSTSRNAGPLGLRKSPSSIWAKLWPGRWACRKFLRSWRNPLRG
jgi:Heterodisulfide reductase, subunit B